MHIAYFLPLKVQSKMYTSEDLNYMLCNGGHTLPGADCDGVSECVLAIVDVANL